MRNFFSCQFINPRALLILDCASQIDTAAFVDAIFLAIHNRSYMPGFVAMQSTPTADPSFPAPSAPTAVHLQNPSRSIGPGDLSQSRKRSYNDKPEDPTGSDPHYGRGDRQLKQIRRGNVRNGRADAFGSRGGRGGFQYSAGPPNIPQGPALTFPGLPMPAPGLPFDPNDPIATMMAMQAMGLPSFPGMPPLPQPTSPTGYDRFGVQSTPILDPPSKTKVKGRCRDYDTRGYCTRGNSCPYEHGTDHVIVPSQDGMEVPAYLANGAN